MIRRIRVMIGWLACGSTALVPTPSVAACSSCSCSVSTGNLSFGTYNASNNSPTAANATVTITCFSLQIPTNPSASVGISGGTSGVPLNRQMASGASRLSYNIYQDAAHTTVWGTGGSNGATQTATLSGLLIYSASLTAYGLIPKNQYVKAGAYTDALVVTITY